MYSHSKKGFTLIELLVVISLIGFLSSVVLASLNTARAKSRDSERVSNAKQISNALELYYDDNKVVPSSLEVLVPKYIAKIPSNFTYTSISNASGSLAVAYTTYETNKTLGSNGTLTNQKIGVLVGDVDKINVCNNGWFFPTCINGSPIDQIINVSAGDKKACKSPQVLNSTGTGCVCPSGTTAQYDLGVFMGCFGNQQFTGGGGLGGGITFP